MLKPKVMSIVWTHRALKNAISIKGYLLAHFSDKEVDSFYAILKSFEIAVCAFPSLYPYSAVKKSLRRAVLSNVLSVYYRVNKEKIEVIAILDNRCDAEKWI